MSKQVVFNKRKRNKKPLSNLAFLFGGIFALFSLAILIAVPLALTAGAQIYHTVTVHVTGTYYVADTISLEILPANITEQLQVPQGASLNITPHNFLLPAVATAFEPLFIGWYLDQNFTTPLPQNHPITRDLTIWARWED